MLYELTQAVRAKGGKVVGGFMGHGRVYHPAPCLNGRLPNRPNKEDLEETRSFARAVDAHLTSGKTGAMAESRADTLKPSFGFYQLMGLIINPFLLRVLLPKPVPDKARCAQCGVCKKACASGSIALTPYPVMGGTCIRCYHFQNVCPEKALSDSWWYGNLVISSLFNTFLARLCGDLKPGESMY